MTPDEAKPGLAATGERLVPELQHGELVHAEHLARYRFAAQLAPSRRALDVACGAGYGTAMLADAGAQAVGVDLDEQAIAYARSRHPGPEFAVADIAELPFEDDAFDLVVSFETIEHVPDPERALAELRRVLAADGLLAISSPNKHQYLVENEFHEREFTHEEFVELLRGQFSSVSVLLQHNWVTSAVFEPGAAADASGERRHEVDLFKVAAVEPGGELYSVALCAGSPPAAELRSVAVVATLDESHALATRLGDAEQTARHWHDETVEAGRVAADWHREFEAAQAKLSEVYASASWRLTSPLRAAKRIVRRKG
jgi:SAM-dependent methyltransferase